MKRMRGKKGRIQGRMTPHKALAEIRNLLGNAPRSRDLLVEHLHKLQDHYGHLSHRHLLALAIEMELPMAEVYETATFYHHFDVLQANETAPPALTVRVCESLTCEMFGAGSLIDELRATIDAAEVRVQPVPCVGRCQAAPVAVVGTNPVEHAQPATVAAALDDGELRCPEPDAVRYSRYREQGGYQVLAQCMDGGYQPEQIITLLENANLRGLGGAGFPAGRKWRILREQTRPRLVAVNIDEGEPGTFKDRYFLERDPHRFIEGTLIACWAIEAEAVYIYLRDEYAGCRNLLEAELAELQRDPPCPLPPIHLRRGAGAYICGEESAMLESIEGKRGMPRLRPPYIAEVGLFGHPTLEQNMETLHWVRDIVEHGPEFLTSHGRHGRKGLRAFSRERPGTKTRRPPGAGRHHRTGTDRGILRRHVARARVLRLFPGRRLRRYPACSAGRRCRWISIPCRSTAALSVPPQSSYCRTGTAPAPWPLNAMRFFEHESCGQCTPCRAGTVKAVKLMEKPEWDRLLLEDLGAGHGGCLHLRTGPGCAQSRCVARCAISRESFPDSIRRLRRLPQMFF